MMLALALLLGVLLDAALGEPRRWHPLVGFGRYAKWLESRCNRGQPKYAARLVGVASWLLAVMPFVLLTLLLKALLGEAAWLLDALLLYFALGARSLTEHARAVAAPLLAGDLVAARLALSRIVSRDTRALDAAQVAGATVESVLENGNDAIFGTLFWFALLGGPGALLFRLANTLDAMWGYRTPRLLHFGWAAARIDDLLNILPARLTALSYALFGEFRQALRCWRTQAPQWDSPNAGPVMASGAGALGLALGGAAIYHGAIEERPVLGCGASPQAADIGRALCLVRAALWLWCGLIVVLCVSGSLLRV
jgi:adenosylcobinamide-phosphate synthase